MKIIAVWPLCDEIEYDDSLTLDDLLLEVITCVSYDWQDIESFLSEAKVGDFVFVRDRQCRESMLFVPRGQKAIHLKNEESNENSN
jgi:hypothetical protein